VGKVIVAVGGESFSRSDVANMVHTSGRKERERERKKKIRASDV
jgi:hypothetical protein